MTTIRGAMLSFVAGLALALFPGCGPKQACDATSCASGCCDAEGTCRPGNTVPACGVGARACVACQGAQSCELGACVGSGTGGGGATGGGSGGGSATGGGGGSTTGGVVINEVATSDGDFFELINTGASTVDLSGFQVADRDDATMGPKLSAALTFPAGTTLGAGAILLIVEGMTAGPSTSCGDATVSTCFAVTFGLSAGNGDSVFLLDGSGAVVTRADVAPMAHAALRSWGRIPDGSGAFVETARTPGLPNRLFESIDAGADAGADGGVDAGIDAGTDAGVDAGTDAGLDAGEAVTFVVVRVGPAADGGTLSGASAPVQLEWRDLSTGAVLRTIALPSVDSSSQRAFVLSGTATSEGLLTSSSGYWTLAGYASTPGISGISSAAGISRVVARVGEDGGVDTSTAVTDAYPGNNVRAAATSDGTRFWLAGTAATNAGVRSAAFGSMTTSTEVFSGVTNIRAVKVNDGQLYASTASDAGAGVPRVFAVGQGLPTALTTMSTPLPGVSLVSAGDFALMDRDATPGIDTLYVVDTNGVGVRRYTLTGGVWSQTSYLLTPGSIACVGVTARAATTGPATVLCSGTNGAIYRWEDEGTPPDGGLPASSAVITAPAGTAFRGLGF